LDDANTTPGGPIADTIWYSPHETLFDYLEAQITAIKQALAAQPAQEPAFWLNEQGQLKATRGDAERHSIGQKIIPLYTAPPAQPEQEPEREALKLALEALKNLYDTCDWHGDDGKEAMVNAPKAITAIKAALAQPEHKPTLQEQLDKALADRDKARADWDKADADRDKARADWDKAEADWVKAEADWVKAEAEIKQIKQIRNLMEQQND
jgi:hypothetical protein